MSLNTRRIGLNSHIIYTPLKPRTMESQFRIDLRGQFRRRFRHNLGSPVHRHQGARTASLTQPTKLKGLAFPRQLQPRLPQLSQKTRIIRGPYDTPLKLSPNSNPPVQANHSHPAINSSPIPHRGRHHQIIRRIGRVIRPTTEVNRHPSIGLNLRLWCPPTQAHRPILKQHNTVIKNTAVR